MAIEIWTDGACSGNPGKGGYGILMRDKEKNHQKHFSQGYQLTTNNRMELLAVVTALEKLKKPNLEVIIHTDSKYVSDSINKKWIINWEKKRFVGVKNPDLWKRLLPLLKSYRVQFIWIKGHAGHPENEFVDQIAVQASMNQNLLIDEGYKALA